MMSCSDIIGKPFSIDGTGPDFFGCWGLARFVAARAGRPLPYFPTPNSLDKRNALFVHVRDSDGFVKIAAPEPWTLATYLMKDGNSKLRWHVGTVLEDTTRFIHTVPDSGVCISRLDDPLWELFFEGFYRYECPCPAVD
jgi:hypothetical protein